jgi:hypothetical protein
MRAWKPAVPLVVVCVLAPLAAPSVAPAARKPLRVNLDRDRKRESVRIVRVQRAPKRVRIVLRDGRRHRSLSPRLGHVSTLRALDATRSGRPEIWFAGRMRGRVVAGLVGWSGRRARGLFAYDARRSPLGARWRGARLSFVDVGGGTRAQEIELVETLRGGSHRTTFYRYLRGRYRAFKPTAVPGSPVAPGTGGGGGGGGAGPVQGITAPPEPSLPPPSAFVAPGGSSGGSCSASAPCTLDRALKVVGPGQLVQVAGGSYPGQVLTPTPPRPAGAPPILVRPAPGASVQMGELDCGRYFGNFGADAVDIADMRIDGAVIQRCDRLTLRRITMTGALFLDGSTNFAMIGGSMGPGVDEHPDVQAINTVDPPIVPTNVLFEGVTFHDWTLATPGVHIECLQVSDVRNLTVRGSRFTNCDTFDLHIQGTVAGPVEDIVIENNVFEPTSDHTGGSTPAYYSFSIRSGKRVLIRNNSSSQAWAWPASDEPIVGWRVLNNAAPLRNDECNDRIEYDHNLWTAARCGPTDRTGPLSFVNSAAGDYRPTAGSLAIDAANPADFPATDILGRIRPRGRGPDIGAYEEH